MQVWQDTHCRWPEAPVSPIRDRPNPDPADPTPPKEESRPVSASAAWLEPKEEPEAEVEISDMPVEPKEEPKDEPKEEPKEEPEEEPEEEVKISDMPVVQ